MTHALPERLGDFVILSRIAEGGMGVVYLAEQQSLRRRVAIKVLKSQFAADPEYVLRFQREARSAARLDHPNIIKIHLVGEEEGQHYFAMEFVEGKTVRDLLRSEKRLDLGDTLDIGVKVADALDCAAAAGIVHRDIKPENIMVTAQGHVKVTDFGLALSTTAGTRMTQPGRILGTVNYMAPEQGLGQETDSRADIYSLGVVFFEMLAGRLPYKAEHPTSVIYMHIHEPIPPIRQFNRRIPEAVEALLLRMMAKDRSGRPNGTGALLQELEALRTVLGLRSRTRSTSFVADAATRRIVDPAAGRRPICLVIDDDPDIVESFRCVAEKIGFEVASATDGVTGLDLWRSLRPAAVILDIHMPRLGGLALLEERRTGDLTGKVLVASASHDMETIRRAGIQEIAGYILKPYEIKVLEQKLRALLPPVVHGDPDLPAT